MCKPAGMTETIVVCPVCWGEAHEIITQSGAHALDCFSCGYLSAELGPSLTFPFNPLRFVSWLPAHQT